MRWRMLILCAVLLWGYPAYSQDANNTYSSAEIAAVGTSLNSYCYWIRSAAQPRELIAFCAKLYLQQGQKILVRFDMPQRRLYLKQGNGKEISYRIADVRADPTVPAISTAPGSALPTLPSDGSGMLAACGQTLNAIDSQSPAQLDLFNGGWCAGYIQGTLHVLQALTERAGPADAFYICVPEDASIGQLSRVAVKWLRDHPENLDKDLTGQLLLALRRSFGCPTPGNPATENPKGD